MGTLKIAVCCGLLFFGGGPPGAHGRSGATEQIALEHWRSLAGSNQPVPRVFARGNNVRFYFQGNEGGFTAAWKRLRVPSEYRANSAILHWDSSLPRLPAARSSWREATVIAREEWQRLSTNLIGALAPETPGHAAFYQAFLADGVLYRDLDGRARLVPENRIPDDIVVDRRHSIQETIEILARHIEARLSQTHPDRSLFLIMSPNRQRLPQPLLLDLKERRCVWLSPAALYDPAETQDLKATFQTLGSVVFESHGLALVKNPVSSAARLADLGVQTGVRFLRRPLPRGAGAAPPVEHAAAMDLERWEGWLDRHTGTRQRRATLDLLIDGDRFFSRLEASLAAATNSIHIETYIFDRDDVALEVADQLRDRAREIEVRLVLDRMGSLGAGLSIPNAAMADGFQPPSGSIFRYLEKNSHVRVRPFLNPWSSSQHSKVYLIDGVYAWLGGMNLGREYRFDWHDAMVEVQGPAVRDLEDTFRRSWAHAGPLGDASYAVASLRPPRRAKQPPAGTDTTLVRFLPTRTAWKPFSTAVLGAIRQARNHVYVQHPYLFDKRVLTALVGARRRGVDVRVVLPRVNDFKAGERSNLVTANYLLKHDVRVYFYPGMTHVKALLVDGWACLGSANLNHLSLRLCQEQNVATSDPAFASRVEEELFAEDFARSYELTEPLSVGWVDFLTDLVLENL